MFILKKFTYEKHVAIEKQINKSLGVIDQEAMAVNILKLLNKKNMRITKNALGFTSFDFNLFYIHFYGLTLDL